MEIVRHYCHHEAGVRNLKKALDRVFRKIVAKLEQKSAPKDEATSENDEDSVEYQINTQNLERFLDIPPTDDSYFEGINKGLPVGTSNGLAYVNDGYGVVLKIQVMQRMQAKKEETDEKEEEKKTGSFTQTGRLGETFQESLEVVKIAVFNLLHERG